MRWPDLAKLENLLKDKWVENRKEKCYESKKSKEELHFINIKYSKEMKELQKQKMLKAIQWIRMKKSTKIHKMMKEKQPLRKAKLSISTHLQKNQSRF